MNNSDAGKSFLSQGISGVERAASLLYSGCLFKQEEKPLVQVAGFACYLPGTLSRELFLVERIVMINRILTAVDGSKASRQACDWAYELALAHQARLVIIHVLLQGVSLERLHLLAKEENFLDEIREDLHQIGLVPTAMPNMVGVTPLVAVPHVVLEKIGKCLLYQTEGRAKRQGVRNVTTRLAEGDAAQAILRCSTETSPDLIIMGSRGLSGIQSLVLGSVSRKVLQDSPCACLIVKEH